MTALQFSKTDGKLLPKHPKTFPIRHPGHHHHCNQQAPLGSSHLVGKVGVVDLTLDHLVEEMDLDKGSRRRPQLGAPRRQEAVDGVDVVLLQKLLLHKARRQLNGLQGN